MAFATPTHTHLRVNDEFMVVGPERDYGKLVNHWFRITSLTIDDSGNRHFGFISVQDPSFVINDITEYGINIMGYVHKKLRD